MYITPKTIPKIPIQNPYLLSLFPTMIIKPIMIKNIPAKYIVKAVKNANMLGLNIKPKLIININIPKIVLINPLVVLYSTSLTPFANKKIESNKTDNPRISDAAITPSIGNAMIRIPKIIAIMLIVVCLCKLLPPYSF